MPYVTDYIEPFDQNQATSNKEENSSRQHLNMSNQTYGPVITDTYAPELFESSQIQS